MPASRVRQRRPGAGVRPAIETQPGLLAALDELVHPETRGTPMSPLRWTCKSRAQLTAALAAEAALEAKDASVADYLPEQIALQAGRPVLVVPDSGDNYAVGERVLVAWNASREATRAIAARSDGVSDSSNSPGSEVIGRWGGWA